MALNTFKIYTAFFDCGKKRHPDQEQEGHTCQLHAPDLGENNCNPNYYILSPTHHFFNDLSYISIWFQNTQQSSDCWCCIGN